MAEGNSHNGDGELELPHLPDPSPWPILVGVGALLVGATILWWIIQDTTLSAAALGAAGAFLLLTIAGWGFEDGKMLKGAEDHHGGGHGGPIRFSQVITFAIPEGQLESARTGVIAGLEDANNILHDMSGFQDLRISIAPAEEGSSQVIAETTWSGREELASYEESRATVLDLINSYPDDVVAGSVQVFDMEVVRDTKDFSMRMGKTATVTVIGAFILGGVALGGGLTLFESDAEGGDGGVVDGGGDNGGGSGGFDGTIVGKELLFEQEAITLPPAAEVTLVFDNQDDSIPHNIAFYPEATAGEGDFLSGCTAGCTGDGVQTAIENGPIQQSFTFTTPSEPGDYGYLCEVHPTTMVGTLTVEEGAPLPGEEPAAGGGGGNEIVATDNAFDLDTLTATAGAEFSVTLTNDGVVPHNIAFYTEEGGDALADTSVGGILNGGESEVVAFTAPDAGTYFFRCDVHPGEMTGDFVVN